MLQCQSRICYTYLSVGCIGRLQTLPASQSHPPCSEAAGRLPLTGERTMASPRQGPIGGIKKYVAFAARTGHGWLSDRARTSPRCDWCHLLSAPVGGDPWDAWGASPPSENRHPSHSTWSCTRTGSIVQRPLVCSTSMRYLLMPVSCHTLREYLARFRFACSAQGSAWYY